MTTTNDSDATNNPRDEVLEVPPPPLVATSSPSPPATSSPPTTTTTANVSTISKSISVDEDIVQVTASYSSSTSPPPSPTRPGVLVGDAAAAAAAVSTSNHVYIRSDEYSWIPARLVEVHDATQTAIVNVPHFKDEQSIVCDGGRSSKKFHKVTVQLSQYPHGLLLQNVDEKGQLRPVADMVDLPFLHEAAILYNLKSRHVQKLPYTRTGDIVIACNPYQWYHHLYNEELRHYYAQALIWDTSNINRSSNSKEQHGDPRRHLEPHVYESSSLAYRGLAVEGDDQSILVSGESGAGKTETVKILLHDLASVQRGRNSGKNNDDNFQSDIVQRVLDSNPLLEAFGNAQTVRNDNSSRFGKFLQLQFDAEDPLDAAIMGKSVPSCVLAGSKCQVYLLEKSRVVRHESNERTYHIFYQLLSADNEQKMQFWEGLEDTDCESFLYVGYTDTDTIEGLTDAERFQLTLQSLQLVGIEGDKLRALMRAICIVLQLGNLLFAPHDTNDAQSIIENQDDLDALADLMGIPAQELTAALTIRTVRARNEEFKVPLNAIQAKDSTDAFAKEIYAKTFLWLVRNINDATCAEKNYECLSPRKQERRQRRPNGEIYGMIGMLDIFGFESFEVNRFEQLCINYANEKLQQKFTQDIFRSVQAEYEFEGIELGEITYDDNTDVLDLVEGRMGLLAFLNEECVRPGGSDKGFVMKARAMNKESPCFKTEASFTDLEFGVHHYAGLVVYDATHFVTKNMDTLPTDLQECATKSTNDIIAKELTNESDMNAVDTLSPSASSDSPQNTTKKKPPPKRAPKRPPTARGSSGGANATSTSASATGPSSTNKADTPNKNRGSNLIGVTVWTKFKNQLVDLMDKLQKTRTRYIRCIKPNPHKMPLVMHHNSTIEQLRCAGVVAAVTISRSAFPNRLEHAIVLDRFKALWRKGDHVFLLKRLESGFSEPDDEEEMEQELRLRNAVETLLTWALKSLEVELMGSLIKAFVIGKTRAYFRAGALEYLENERVKALSVWAVEMQKIARRFLMRSRYTKIRFATIRMQTQQRMRTARESYRSMRAASIRVENWYRCKCAARTLIILRRHHMATMIQNHWRMAVAITVLKTKRRASIVVQTMVRGALQRPKFRIALHEKREEAKLENQVRALQRKLEEAEARRVEAERQAEERARRAVEEFQKQGEEEKKDTPASSVASASEHKSAAISKGASVSSFHTPASPPKDNGLSAQQQQTLMDESGKMLEYLRKEVYKLRSQNVQLRTDCDLLKDNNQRLMDANASAGASFQALNQHTKQLVKSSEKVKAELAATKQQVHKLNVTQVELKEELKMKQATYVAEVHSRLQYAKALGSIVDLVQERSRDTRLVEDVLRIADACEAEYMSGPTGMTTGSRLFASSPSSKPSQDSSSGLMSSIRSLWS